MEMDILEKFSNFFFLLLNASFKSIDWESIRKFRYGSEIKFEIRFRKVV